MLKGMSMLTISSIIICSVVFTSASDMWYCAEYMSRDSTPWLLDQGNVIKDEEYIVGVGEAKE